MIDITFDPEISVPAGYSAFAADRRIGRGDLGQVARAAHAHAEASPLVFEDATGRLVDLDLRGSAEDAVARVRSPAEPPRPARGRPKLGVTAREVTLLPRHWSWLATQPGGASAALRRLVDQARRASGGADAARQAKEATYRIMTTLAGDRPGYEEAVRALFAGDLVRLTALASAWPKDIADYVGERAPNSDAPQQAAIS
ncbi:DUF2239 family protein [Phenylobacterium sp.]|uniref:DUF2239 family protein n=1 Tax=Phenylobacterium sp. TaxID=1871053 RepID=UPI00374CB233